MEFDAVLVGGAAPPAPDAVVSRDSKAGDAATTGTDPRVVLLLEECFRHSKAIGAWGAGVPVLEAARCAGEGVVSSETASEVVTQVHELLGSHRVWERFVTTR